MGCTSDAGARERLLVVGCSRAKRAERGLLPALQRYDGPAFRVVRRHLPQVAPPRVYVLSAAFGLIPADRPVPPYDVRMTPERAAELTPEVRPAFQRLLAGQQWDDVFIHLARSYLAVLGQLPVRTACGAPIHVATGPPGVRLAQLCQWLTGGALATAADPTTPLAPGTVRFRGLELDVDRQRALELARAAAEQWQFQAGTCVWYVLIDGEPVGAKWLAARLTGVPASSFRTQQACCLLRRLGLEVRRR